MMTRQAFSRAIRARTRTIGPQRSHPATALQAAVTTPGRAVRGQCRVAYLTNLYPAISHSFIRTEIEAVERAGFVVERFSVRQATDYGDDRDEMERTRVLLGNKGALLASVLRRFASDPARTARTLVDAMRAGGRGGFSPRRLVRAAAYFAEAAALADAMERSGIRHVHAHFGTNPASVARLVARMTDASYSFTAHGPDEFDAPVELDLAGKIADAAFVVGVSSFGRSQLMRWSDPAHWPRIKVVHCSVADRFLETTPAPVVSRRLISVARLNAQKGLPLLIEAIARLHDLPAFRVDIIGDGDQRAAIQARIAALGIGGRVRLLGWCSPQRVLREVSGARAFVLPSFAEGLPVGIMEAMALGRPVIASAIAGIPELVDAQTGWLVPAGSVDALADAMRAALDASPDTLRAMGTVGRERVQARHSAATNAATLATLLARQL